MRFILGGLCATFALLLAAGPVAAETVNCPLTTARRNITNALPSGWFSTPVQSRLTETRVMNIGSQAHMACVYGEAGVVLREAPAGQSCTARTGGFECGAGATPPMPASEAFSTGAFTVRGTYNIDVDAGVEGASANAEFWYEVIRENESYFTPRNGARYAVIGASEPGYAGCTAATYSAARLRIETLSGRPWLCVRTNEGRIAQIRIDGVDRTARPMRMTLSHTTWR